MEGIAEGTETAQDRAERGGCRLDVVLPVKREVDSSILSLTTRSDQAILLLTCDNVRRNVTCGHFALLRCSETTLKDREVAARITATRRTPVTKSHQYRLPHTPLPWT